MKDPKDTLENTNIFAESIREFQRGFTHYMGYQIVFLLLTFIALSPVLSLIYTFLIRSSGQTSLTNEGVISYLFSVRGFITVQAWGMLTFFLIFAEQAGIIFICSTARSPKESNVLNTMRFILQNILSIFKLGVQLFWRFVLFSLPFLILWGLTFFLLLSEYDINYYLAKKPPAFWIALFIGGLSLIGYLVLLLTYLTRWIFILQLCVLQQEPLARVFRRSSELTRGAGMYILRVLALWTLGIWVFITILLAGFGLLNQFILENIGNNPKVVIPVMALLYTINFILTTFFISLVISAFSIVLTKLYDRRLQATGVVAQRDIRQELAPSETVRSFGRFQKMLPGIVIGIILIATLTLGLSVIENLNQPDTVKVSAHRGSSAKAPENSLSAIRQAIADEADYAEIDVQETADDVIVVIHDGDLMRITGHPLKLWETPYEQIKTLDAGSWFSPEFAGEQIPTLEEAIEVARNKIKLNIELKFNGHAKQLTERVVEIVQKQNFRDQCVISSLDYQAVLKAKELDNKLQVGYILYGAFGRSFDLQTDFFSVSKDIVSESFIANAHKRNKDVHIWTFSDQPNALERFIYLGVDNIITDYPAELVTLLKKRAEMNDVDRLKENFLKWLQR